jgi:tRNA 2-thiouridine synthesizing protein B
MSNSTLHILNRGPNQPDLLRHLLDAFSEGDEILLIEDGVYWGSDHFAAHFNHQRPKVLAPDAQARGLELKGLIDDGEFVDLCVKHARSVSWS